MVFGDSDKRTEGEIDNLLLSASQIWKPNDGSAAYIHNLSINLTIIHNNKFQIWIRTTNRSSLTQVHPKTTHQHHNCVHNITQGINSYLKLGWQVVMRCTAAARRHLLFCRNPEAIAHSDHPPFTPLQQGCSVQPLISCGCFYFVLLSRNFALKK